MASARSLSVLAAVDLVESVLSVPYTETGRKRVLRAVEVEIPTLLFVQCAQLGARRLSRREFRRGEWARFAIVESRHRRRGGNAS
jgi:hypothetical protein